jgi:hypothetical protein
VGSSVVKRASGGIVTVPAGGCADSDGGPQIELGLRFFRWWRRRALMKPSPIEAWGQDPTARRGGRGTASTGGWQAGAEGVVLWGFERRRRRLRGGDRRPEVGDKLRCSRRDGRVAAPFPLLLQDSM